MAGCYGNSDIDRWLERQVDEYNSDNNTDTQTDSDDDDIYGDDDDL